MKARLFYALYLLVAAGLILGSVELASTVLLARKRSNPDDQYVLVLDPHLGFGYTAQTSPLKRLTKALEARGHRVDNGFVTFGASSAQSGAGPKILIMGGSTTDPFFTSDGHLMKSWPETLTEILREKGKAATVITGAVSGFNSSQELFKLIRDGLEFKPDVILSYGGLRENEKNEPLPYPMVHNYQRYVLRYMVDRLANVAQAAPFMKNTVALLKGNQAPVYEATFGLPSKNSHAEAWLRNMRVMNAVATAFGTKFCAILQPAALLPDSRETDTEKAARIEAASLRNEQQGIVKGYPFFLDLTDLFTKTGRDIRELTPDGAHATEAGNKLVAEAVYEQLFEAGKCVNP